MSKFLGNEQCPACAARGRDRSRNNLGTYSDGSCHCWACGYHKQPDFKLNFLTREQPNDTEKTVLPRDFTREVPAEGWQWLLQYGLSYSYWQEKIGFSPKENRLVFTVGTPTRFSIGRSLTVGGSKWKVYGDKSSYVEIISEQLSNEVVLVEDLISAAKVGSITSTIPLFGTSIHDNVLKVLIRLNRPVALWLDADQYGHLAKKIGRLQALSGLPVRYIRTDKDPKSYSITEIKEILK